MAENIWNWNLNRNAFNVIFQREFYKNNSEYEKAIFITWNE